LTIALPLAYSLRNLWTRRLTTALTAGGMALVVFVFAAVLMLDEGLRKTLVETGWSDIDQLMPAFHRPVYSSMLFKLADADSFEALRQAIDDDPRLKLEAKRETQYYADQSEVLSKFVRILGLTLSAIFSVGAIIGAMITMYAAVANRTAEIGTLRALGFRRSGVLAAFLLESLLLSLVGGLLGLGLASFMQLFTVSTMNWQSFNELAFSFTLNAEIVAKSLAFALAMGLAGGFLPALRAARLGTVDALRAA